jgi:putative ABC transport system substrate-binding protein
LAAACPAGSRAQLSADKAAVAWLSGATQAYSAANIAAFLQGMRDLGYVEGKNFDMVYRFSDGYQDRLPRLAAELVELKPSIILATAIIAAVAAKRATWTIPIVCPALADAAELGLIFSVARPSGNVTGIEPYVPGLPAKLMQFVLEILPNVSRVGLLTNLRDQKAAPQVVELQAAARSSNINIVSADANQPEDIDNTLQALASQRVGAVIVLQTTMLLSESRRIAAAALARKLPTVYGYRDHVLVGGLISYGVDLRWCFHRGAYFVDKILHGVHPGDLPVEFPTKMVLTINLKTAQALEITLPPTLIGRADEVIE